MGVYQRLGVQPVINARGMNTMASGSLMPQPVLDAMAEAATAFVDMEELNRKAGEHIARLIGVEAAHVTSGSAGGLLLAAAACIAGDDPAAITQLPDTTGLRDGIIIEACRRIRYDQALRAAGARLVEVGDEQACTPEQMEAAIDATTAAIIHIVSPYLGRNGVPLEAAIDIAHRHGLPIIVDAASTLPPTNHLTRWTSMGADLVIYSGGKGIRGPQGSGLLLGRRDLIRAAAANGAPNGAIGRPCKVSKEDIVGLVTALELFLEEDWTIEWARHTEQAREIVGALDRSEEHTSELQSRQYLVCRLLLDTKKGPAALANLRTGAPGSDRGPPPLPSHALRLRGHRRPRSRRRLLHNHRPVHPLVTPAAS